MTAPRKYHTPEAAREADLAKKRRYYDKCAVSSFVLCHAKTLLCSLRNKHRLQLQKRERYQRTKPLESSNPRLRYDRAISPYLLL